MTRVSIIVPLPTSSPVFEDTLASVLRYRPAGAEVIVVSNGPYDDPHDLSSEVRFVAAECQSRHWRLDLLRRGSAESKGRIIVWIRPGVELDEGWHESMQAAFEQQDIASVSPIVVSRMKPLKILAAGAEVDKSGTRKYCGQGRNNVPATLSRLRPVGPTNWLAAWRSDVLQKVLPLASKTEDVFVDIEIALMMRKLGFRSTILDSFCGFVDNEFDVLDELLVSHGRAAQRACENYLLEVGTGLLGNLINDLVRAPVSPWRIKHALGRIGASKWRLQDRQRMEQLGRFSKKRENLSDWNPTTTMRRAA